MEGFVFMIVFFFDINNWKWVMIVLEDLKFEGFKNDLGN